MFLLTVMPAFCSAASATLPVSFLLRRSHEHQVVVGAARHQAQAAFDRASARAPWRCRRCAAGTSLKPGLSASPKATALAAMTCIERPALDAREDLAVDRLAVRCLAEDQAAARAAQRLVRRRRHDVGVAAPATDAARPRPARRCAPCPPISSAPTSSAICPELREVEHARIGARRRRRRSSGLRSCASARAPRRSRCARSCGRRRSARILKSRPEKFTGEPCVRCPPCARSRPRMRVAGLRAARSRRPCWPASRVRLHVRVLGAEERFARSMASSSTMSTTSQPP